MEEEGQSSLSAEHVQDLRLAASKLTGAKRRSFQAEMTLKYCGGSARRAERVFGWRRETVQLGLHEKRTGIECLGAQSAFGGRTRWETKFPHIAEYLRQLAEAHAQQDPTFRTSLAYTRLTAEAALEALKQSGYDEAELPSARSMGRILNRMGFRLRPVVKAKPKKKSQKQTPSSKTSAKKTTQPLSNGSQAE